jgi:hypothetical protein
VSFGFDARHLTDGSVPAVQCAVCGKEEWTPFVINNVPVNVLFSSIHLPSIISKVGLVKNLLQQRWFRRYGTVSLVIGGYR